MSKPSLAGREQQQSSPFGLRHKQAKKAPKIKKIRCKCATVAHYSMSYRFLCNRCNEQAKKQKIRRKRATSAPYFSCVTRATRPLAHAAIPGVELTLPKPLAFAKGQKQPQVL
jgi:hypothetical protein